jgi:hypothetical protein
VDAVKSCYKDFQRLAQRIAQSAGIAMNGYHSTTTG